MTRRGARAALLLGGAALVVVALIQLGNWQLRRLEWKLELIDAVESRAHAEPVPAPTERIDVDEHVYRRVTITGRYLHRHTRYVKAVTDLGPGFWTLTPLDEGRRLVWINRGFVPGERRGRHAEPEGDIIVIGLLRETEPGGTLLQSNDPANDRWYSRDVDALSSDTGLDAESAYFIDAVEERGVSAERWPRAGLTLIEFRNPHLAYALTWYAMAAGLVLAVGYVVRLERT